MTLKESLKPNKWKIIVFLIIGTIVLTIEFMSYCFGPGPNASPFACLGTILSIFYTILNPFLLLNKIINGKELIYFFTTTLFIILEILYVYIISSLIINKIKK